MQLYEDMEAGKVSNPAGRARAFVARVILETNKVEIVASRTGLASFDPVDFNLKDNGPVIEHSSTGKVESTDGGENK